MHLSKREKVLLIGTLFIGIIVLFIYFYYQPLKEKIKELDAKSLELDDQILERQQKKQLVEGLKAEITKLEERAEDSQKYFMPTIDEPDILYYIHNFIWDKTIKQTLSYNEVEDLAVYKQKDIHLEYSTSYNELLTTLRLFEQGENYVTPQALKLEVDAEASGKYEIAENGDIIVVEEPKTPYDLKINHSIRFYGLDSTWDGSGDYEFMKDAKFYSDLLGIN